MRRDGDQEIANQRTDVSSTGVENTVEFDLDSHVYLGERCMRCNTNIYDAAIYGPSTCAVRDDDTPISYSTSTGATATSSHPEFLDSSDGLIAPITNRSDSIKPSQY